MTNIFTNPEMNDLRMSEKARPLFDAVVRHINDNVVPIAEKFEELGKGRADRWSWAPGQLEWLQTAKDKAKAFPSHFTAPLFLFCGCFGRAGGGGGAGRSIWGEPSSTGSGRGGGNGG